MPLTGDLTTGVYWRPEGGEYLAGSPNSVFDATDLEPAWNDFEELVWPALAQRIPAFEELKLTGGWAGYYDCNKLDNNSKEQSLDLMKISNPVVIPRNHKVEEALDAAHKGDLKILNRLLSVLNKPYEIDETIEEFQSPSFDNEYQTFCGT